MLDAGVSRARRARNDGMARAWHIAAFGRAKKMPPLTKVIEEAPRARRPMTPDQLQSAVAGWLSNRPKTNRRS